MDTDNEAIVKDIEEKAKQHKKENRTAVSSKGEVLTCELWEVHANRILLFRCYMGPEHGP